MAANQKRQYKCPPIPAGWDSKFTGPALEPGDDVHKAAAKWAAYLRMTRKLYPMPRQDRGPHR